MEGALACGLWAPHTRTHPDGEVVAMCDEHTAEFDRLIAERDRALQAAGVVVVRPVQEETHED